jgi:hypothetical protein
VEKHKYLLNYFPTTSFMIEWKIIPSAGEETAAPSPPCVGLVDCNNGARKDSEGSQLFIFALKLLKAVTVYKVVPQTAKSLVKYYNQ